MNPQLDKPLKSYWDIHDFYDDFEALYNYKTMNIDEVMKSKCKQGNNLDVYEDHLDNGCRYRRVYPHGKAEFWRNLKAGSDEKCQTETVDDEKSHRFWFVGFFGEMKDEGERRHDILKQIWEIDNILIKELTNHQYIFFYGTCELQNKRGDYFNLVLFNRPEAAEQWRGAYGHDRAVSISPFYYKEVHIHMGELTAGLRGNEFLPHRTTFVDYSQKQTTRHVRNWELDKKNRVTVHA